jgi:hypothetical protein
MIGQIIVEFSEAVLITGKVRGRFENHHQPLHSRITLEKEQQQVLLYFN